MSRYLKCFYVINKSHIFNNFLTVDYNNLFYYNFALKKLIIKFNCYFSLCLLYTNLAQTLKLI